MSRLGLYLAVSFFYSTSSWVSAYKMALFVPDISNSQVLFNTRVAETLAKAGHDVTMIMISFSDDMKGSYVNIMKEVSIYRVNASFGLSKKDVEENQKKALFEDMPVWDSRQRASMSKKTAALTESCRKTVENKEFLEWLVAQKFDLALAHIFDVCPIGLIHYAKIPSWIWLSSGGLADFMAYYMGVPTFPSYNPPVMMESTDDMNFFERTKSLIGHVLVRVLWRRHPLRNIVATSSEPKHSMRDFADMPSESERLLHDVGDTSSKPGRLLSNVAGMSFEPERPLRDIGDTSADDLDTA
ncbi:unnamed protein product [Heligmosomoides polygyrus]|uniref:glucuronosyltransferase n=1 Tax=Heligmosomoides polygyrus TaxID=6339 RepID=A0A183FK07_HELPZ|nr:unnamed protein product [Heligmosomoides polygyrus]